MQANELIGLIEAAYRVEAAPAIWLRGVLEATRRHLDGGLGVAGYFVDTRAANHFEVSGYVGLGSMGSAEGIARFEAWNQVVPV